jgi:hypothetical protein
LLFVIVGIGIPDGRFVVQGGVGVGMLKWQTSEVPLAKRGNQQEGRNYELWLGDWY